MVAAGSKRKDHANAGLDTLVPVRPPRYPYDIRRSSSASSTTASSWAPQPEAGDNVNHRFARMDGRTVIVANQPAVQPGCWTSTRLGQGALCPAPRCFNVPITWSTCRASFPAKDQSTASSRHGAKLLYAYVEAVTVPGHRDHALRKPTAAPANHGVRMCAPMRELRLPTAGSRSWS